MKRALFALAATIALVVVPLGAAESSYSDSAGDSGSVPDITTVTVSNTDDGVVTMRITAPLVDSTLAVAMLDTDRNRATGSDGIDRGVMVGMLPGGVLMTLVVDGNGAIVPGVTIASTFSSGVVQISFPKESLAIDQGFDFWLWTASLVEGNEDMDEAPNVDFWTYELTKPAPPPPVKPLIGAPISKPAAPVAGKAFAVAFPVTASDTGAPLLATTVACTTKVAGKVVPHVHKATKGWVAAALVIPKKAKGKQLKIAAKVTANGQTATKIVTYKIR